MTFTVEELDLIYSALNRYSMDAQIKGNERLSKRIDSLCDRIEEAQGVKK